MITTQGITLLARRPSEGVWCIGGIDGVERARASGSMVTGVTFTFDSRCDVTRVWLEGHPDKSEAQFAPVHVQPTDTMTVTRDLVVS